MIIVFLGAPGSGKGTQASRLAARRHMVHLSTGDLLREARARGTPLGRLAAEHLDAGRLVPDDLVAGLVAERLNEGDDFLLDGFPRNISQAARLDDLIREAGQTLAAVVFFEVPEGELVRRLVKRARSDDTPDTIRRRLHVYAEETAPLIAHYEDRGVLRRVAGVGDIEEIAARVARAVGDEGEALTWPLPALD